MITKDKVMKNFSVIDKFNKNSGIELKKIFLQ